MILLAKDVRRVGHVGGVQLLASVQVMISLFMGTRPASDSMRIVVYERHLPKVHVEGITHM